MAKVKTETQTADVDNNNIDAQDQDQNQSDNTAATAVKQRVHRMSQKLKLPEGDSTVGSVTVNFADGTAPIVYEVDFAALAPAVLYAAALNGIAGKFATATSRITDTAEIAKTVNETIAEFAKGEFTTRTLREKSQEYPDIVYAWIAAAGKDADAETLAYYGNAWANRNKEDQAKIKNNIQVIEELEKIQVAKRLERKRKNASTDELEIL